MILDTQGTPQFIQLSFQSRVIPKRIAVTFQGGFAGTRCLLEAQAGQDSTAKTWKEFGRVYPEDVNRKQVFDLVPSDPGYFREGIWELKIVFEESSDFFGRLTVYDLQLYGEILS